MNWGASLFEPAAATERHKLKQLSPTFTSFPLIGEKMLGKLDTEIWLECRMTVSVLDHSAEWTLLERGAYWCQHLPLEPEALN